MALNLKNPEVESLAAEAAALSGQSKTEAVRQALLESVHRLRLGRSRQGARTRAEEVLAEFRKHFPKAPFGRPVTKAQREEILGYGPEGF